MLAASLASMNADDIDVQVGGPMAYYTKDRGQFESQQSATRLILILAGVSVVGMFVVLMILFPSVRIVLQILNALPTAFIGGVMALVITQQDLTVASLVGFISLGGIAVRNGILLVTHYIHLMKEEGEEFTREMVLRGSLERLAPVLMTALTAGIGLVPLVLGELGDAPVVQHAIVQPVLVDRSQLVEQRLVEEIDDLLVALHVACSCLERSGLWA